ncbi:MAG: acyl-CoA dehydrogenase family protein [Pseudomonadota bacterium]
MKSLQGGNFLIAATDKTDIFIPEELSFEQKELANLAARFSMREVFSQSEKIEELNYELSRELVRKAGEQGLLLADIPTNYNGLGLDKLSSMLISENFSHQGSFSVTINCHLGIGTLPLLYYGTEDQKKRYLPKLATGEIISAYSLTEADAGTDALSIKTKAKLAEDKKHYLLNGEKVFCTNGGLADLITVFAKVDGDKFTAFLVEKNFPGVVIAKEENKMGIKGASTTAISFQNAQIPVENVLGEVGQGHKIAFNVLNLGRAKLGAACVGGMKRSLEIMTSYANQRYQFGKPIAEFQLIQEKVANSAVKTYLAESMIYRLWGDIAQLDKQAQDKIKFLQEFAAESSMAKVFCSEALQTINDNALQVHGGYGYMHDYPVEHNFRNARINSIFEGTNEINRLIISQVLLKRALAGRLPLLERLQEILVELKSGLAPIDANQPLSTYIDQVERLKRLTIYVAGVAAQTFTTDLENQQTILAFIADLATATYTLESGLIRCLKVMTMENIDSKIHEAAIKVAIAEQVPALNTRARQALINIAKGNEAIAGPYLKAFDRIAAYCFTNTSSLKETIAKHVLEREMYDL